MSSLHKLCFTVLLLIVTVFAKVSAQPAEIIPDFTLFRQDKTSFTNKDLDSNKLLFFIFFDVRCQHCQQAMQTINKRYSEFNNTIIHLITLDKPEEVSAFLNQYGKTLLEKKNVMLFYDLRNEFITRFKPKKYPSMFLYTPQKKLMIYDDEPEHLSQFFDRIKAYSK